MTLDRVRFLMKQYAGAIKAWALRPETLDAIFVELGIKGVGCRSAFGGQALPNIRLFEIPVVFVYPDHPEGVII